MTKRRLLKSAAWLAALPLLAAALFLFTALIGSSIPRNASWSEPDEGITIFIGDNGVHTEIVMPLVTAAMDWRSVFPASDLPAARRPYSHVAVSWGEREVFLNTPTWADLKLSTTLGAAFGGDGLIHAAHYVLPAPSSTNRPLRITEGQYRALAARILAQVPMYRGRTVYPGYASHDVFYDAPGIYHAGNTCNQWTADTLAAAGIKIGYWSPLSGGVMKWIADPEGH